MYRHERGSFVHPSWFVEHPACRVAREVNKGRRSCVMDVEVWNEENKLVAKLQITGFFFEK